MDKEVWIFINSFAPWLSAVGSLSAVIFSLYLSRQDKRIHLDISAGYKVFAQSNYITSSKNLLHIHIVNMGYKEVQINQLLWKTGIIKKKYAIQVLDNNTNTDSIPKRLKFGEDANYFIILDDKYKFIDTFIAEYLPNFQRLRLHFIKLIVYTTIGKSFSCKLEKGFIKFCIEYISKQYKNMGSKKD